MKPRHVIELLKETGRVWYEHESYRLSAALAYYAAVSLAPALIIAVAVASLVFGEQAAQGQLVEQIEATVGPHMAQTIQEIIGQTHTAGSGVLATIVGVAVMLVSSTTVFVELQNALNTIWDVRPKADRGWLDVLKSRFWSFTLVLGTGLLLLVPLVGSAALDKFFPTAAQSGSFYWWQAVAFITSLGLLTVFFAMIYKLLPDIVLTWWDVLVGAAVTAGLFTLGKYLVGLYLGHFGLASAYGTAGSLAVFLVWVYYSSQILLFGAAFTKAYANKYGRPMVHPDRAEPHPRRGPGKSQDSDSESSQGGARHLSHDRESAR